MDEAREIHEERTRAQLAFYLVGEKEGCPSLQLKWRETQKDKK
jgi:hypothetical protein